MLRGAFLAQRRSPSGGRCHVRRGLSWLPGVKRWRGTEAPTPCYKQIGQRSILVPGCTAVFAVGLRRGVLGVVQLLWDQLAGWVWPPRPAAILS
jgi:hypothetical protein